MLSKEHQLAHELEAVLIDAENGKFNLTCMNTIRHVAQSLRALSEPVAQGETPRKLRRWKHRWGEDDFATSSVGSEFFTVEETEYRKLERELAQMAIVKDALANAYVAERKELREQKQRAESAERRASELEAKLAEAQRDAGVKQAQIDRLMLEYCPDEMTPEQLAEWGRNQKPVEDDGAIAALAAERKEGKQHG